MDIIEGLISNITKNILYNISIDKFSDDSLQQEFINKYNKPNYSKICIKKMNNKEKEYKMNRVLKYKKIYSSIIIQKYYRRYKIRLFYKNKISN